MYDIITIILKLKTFILKPIVFTRMKKIVYYYLMYAQDYSIAKIFLKLLLHSPNAYKSQGRVRLKSGDEELILDLLSDSQASKYFSYHLLHHRAPISRKPGWEARDKEPTKAL